MKNEDNGLKKGDQNGSKNKKSKVGTNKVGIENGSLGNSIVSNEPDLKLKLGTEEEKQMSKLNMSKQGEKSETARDFKNKEASTLLNPIERNTAFGKQKFVKKIIVDMEKGDVRSLEEALEIAEEGTIIKLCEGVYTCNVEINKPGIKIEPRDKDKPVYLLGNDGPVIKVNLKEKQFVVIKRILLAHSGINIANKWKDQKVNEIDYQRKANVKCLSEFELSKEVDTVILVQKGGLILRNCLVSLRSLPKNLSQKVPCMVAMPNTRVNIVNCEFMGNDNNMTTGGIFINSDLVVSSTRFLNFRAGALFTVSHVEGHVVIQDCEISKCEVVGIYTQGNDAKQYILRTKIDNIDGIGIRVHKGNRAKIKGCTIVKCITGIEVLSADPLIIMNNIKQNFENGIVTIAKNFLRCDSTIKFNVIEKNKDNGILCAGKENYTRIEKNQSIANNRRAGIKAIEGAFITVIKNKINSNFAQGILLVESTSGHIEQNEVFTNFKANIAFGGDNSSDTVIQNNKIYSSRSEGIFVIESGFSWIKNNQIYDNNDGIIMFDSSPHISENYINENQRAGMIVSGSSFPRIEKNSIFGNTTSGIIIRDNSIALIMNNKIFSNYYQVSTRKMAADKIKLIVEDNEIEGPNEFTNNCVIF